MWESSQIAPATKISRHYVREFNMFGTSTVKTLRMSCLSYARPHLDIIKLLTGKSYNHDFSEDEIWFIMVKSHGVNHNTTDDVLKLFKEEFPDHDWGAFVDELLAIEAIIAKYQRESPYVSLCLQMNV